MLYPGNSLIIMNDDSYKLESECCMGVQVLFSFVIYALINAFTPGPGNILALNTMTNYGWKRGKPLFFGIFAGYFFVQALCAFFLFGLESLINPLMNVLKYAGAIYILWLAYQVALVSLTIKHQRNSLPFG